MEYRILTVSPADKKQVSAAGHALAKEMLSKKTAIPADTLCFSKTPEGKPYLPDCDWQFSISHTGNTILCGIHNGAIGADIEKTRPYNDRVAKRICSPAEYTYIGKNSTRFLEVWTRKEAYAKLIGRGLSISLRTIHVASDTTLHETIYGYRVHTVAENGYVYSIIWESTGD